ncbi:ATP-binding protein [Streptomyces sp. RFCAC02]|uniref:sensor histidine kinase n=1 Tax=Streptomyces sp. RFCAC02 TaxID=2499143 RepID=UPI0010205027|nr:ATP-binding protein [Streptomyces sp. RFCAC02]
MPRPVAPRFRWTVRLRLTALYGTLFLATGVLLLTVTYLLVAHTPPWAGVEPPAPPELVPSNSGVAEPQVPLDDDLGRQRASDLQQLLVASGIALAWMTFVSIGLGWLMAGRVLRPLHTMAVTVRSISARDLHQRLDACGPADEVKELADTFDGLLAHLEDAFEAQRRFVANASHELRTPLTFERSVLEIALADQEASVTDLRDACRRVLDSNRQQGELIEALLTLARSQRGIERRTELDLAVLAGTFLAATRPDAAGPRVEAELSPAPVSGDPALVERLLANVVDNAMRHNAEDGWVTVRTGVHAGRPTLRVRNSGPVIPPAQVASLLQPFQRLHATRLQGQDGWGVGLSIVAAIAAAHDARLDITPLPAGGLDMGIGFPQLPPEPGNGHP